MSSDRIATACRLGLYLSHQKAHNAINEALAAIKADERALAALWRAKAEKEHAQEVKRLKFEILWAIDAPLL